MLGSRCFSAKDDTQETMKGTAMELLSQLAHPHRQGDVAGLTPRSRCPLRRRERRRLPCGRGCRAADAVLGRERGAEQRIRSRARAEALRPRGDLPLPRGRGGGLAAGALRSGSGVSSEGRTSDQGKQSA